MGAIAAVFATASLAGGTLSLHLRYEMVCGQPGRGPVVVRLPAAFGLSRLRVRVRGDARPFTLHGPTITISLRRPPRITCMSITEGDLPITISGVRAAAGTYAIDGTVNGHAFTAALRARPTGR